MNYQSILAIATVLTMSLSACNNDKPAESYHAPGQSPNTMVEDPTKVLFEARCSNCHGNDGTAGIGSAANLQISKLDSTAIIKTISDGKGGMPPFKNSLNDTDIQKLERYVYSLRK